MKEMMIGGHLCHVFGSSLIAKAWCWLDLDNLIIDSGRSKAAACMRLFGREIPAHLLESDKLKQAGLTKDEYRLIQTEVYRGSSAQLVPIQGAMSGILGLISYDIVPGILTARHDENELVPVRDFFRGANIKVPIIGVGYQTSKEGAKADVLEDVPARIYFDDDITMINAILAKGQPSYKLCHFDPEGRESVPPGVEQVRNWTEIVGTIFLTA